jgi:putative acetyltransferase
MICETAFRRARPADRDAVVALIFDVLRSFGFEPEPQGLDADAMEFGRSGDPAIAEYVAEIDGRIVGSIALRDRGDGSGRISKLFVAQDARGRGAGKQLLALAVDEAARKRLRTLDLETRSQFEAAIHLYESTGWKRGPNPSSACDRTYELQLP